MSQPPAYTRQFDFTDWSTSYPTAQQPGVSLDAELNAVKTTVDAVLRNLVLIQRDDGALKNGVVTMDALSAAVLLTFGAGVSWVPRGAWSTATVYAVGDVVSNGTGTYVCAIAHTSGTFASDLAGLKWTLLFDSAGATPADGSVTTAKLADGAVTAAKIGFTSLDLTGSIRGQGGLSAGTASTGALLHAKAATGAAQAKIERTADAQGVVGYQIIGVGATWALGMAVSSNDLTLNAGSGGTTWYSAGSLDQAGALRATGSAVPAAGTGAEMSLSASIAYFQGYDRGASAWLEAKLRGLNVYLTASGVDVVKVTSTTFEVTGTPKANGVELGFRGIPQNAQNGAYTLALTDAGGHVYSKNVAGQTVTIPANASVAFPIGTAITLLNNGTNAITVNAAAVTLRQAGTTNTGNRTLATKGLVTLLKVETDLWFISGVGLS